MIEALTAHLAERGLNRLAVLHLADLPAPLRQQLPLAPDTRFRQLLLLGHGGRQLWQVLKQTPRHSPHPIDDFTIDTLVTALAAHAPTANYRILYPGECSVGLQALGELAGWHHASPLQIGIDANWGTWFAYRAVVLTDTNFPKSARETAESPCLTCRERPCLDACPAGALADGHFDLKACISFRRTTASPCSHTCLARLACPVGSEHRYEEGQIRHSYGHSLATIEAWAAQQAPGS